MEAITRNVTELACTMMVTLDRRDPRWPSATEVCLLSGFSRYRDLSDSELGRLVKAYREFIRLNLEMIRDHGLLELGDDIFRLDGLSPATVGPSAVPAHGDDIFRPAENILDANPDGIFRPTEDWGLGVGVGGAPVDKEDIFRPGRDWGKGNEGGEQEGSGGGDGGPVGLRGEPADRGDDTGFETSPPEWGDDIFRLEDDERPNPMDEGGGGGGIRLPPGVRNPITPRGFDPEGGDVGGGPGGSGGHRPGSPIGPLSFDPEGSGSGRDLARGGKRGEWKPRTPRGPAGMPVPDEEGPLGPAAIHPPHWESLSFERW